MRACGSSSSRVHGDLLAQHAGVHIVDTVWSLVSGVDGPQRLQGLLWSSVVPSVPAARDQG